MSLDYFQRLRSFDRVKGIKELLIDIDKASFVSLFVIMWSLQEVPFNGKVRLRQTKKE